MVVPELLDADVDPEGRCEPSVLGLLTHRQAAPQPAQQVDHAGAIADVESGVASEQVGEDVEEDQIGLSEDPVESCRPDSPDIVFA